MLTQIKSIYINDKKPSGEPYIDKSGSPFKRAVLETADGKKASMILGSKYGAKDLATIQTWRPGDSVDIVFDQVGDFLNFKLPTKTDIVVEKTNSLEERVSAVESQIKSLYSFVKSSRVQKETRELQKEIQSEAPTLGEVRLEDIPF